MGPRPTALEGGAHGGPGARRLEPAALPLRLHPSPSLPHSLLLYLSLSLSRLGTLCPSNMNSVGHAPFGRVTRDGAAVGWGPRRPGRVVARAGRPPTSSASTHHFVSPTVPPSIPPTLRGSLSDPYGLPPSLPQIRALSPLRPSLSRPSINPSNPPSLLFSLPPSLRLELWHAKSLT